MRKKVSEIFSNPYGQDAVCCEPSRNEIERAVRENNLQKRGFQEHLDDLKAEWERSGDERYYQIRMYHARRFASPTSRKYLGIDEVEVKIEGRNPETAD